MYNVVTTLAPSFLIGSSFFQVTRTAIKSWMGLKFRKIGPGAAELAAFERPEKFAYTYNGRNDVTTQAPSISVSYIKVSFVYSTWII